jgi:hypothetical protein
MYKAFCSLIIAGCLGLATPAAGQETRTPADSLPRLDLPEVVASAVVDFFNDPRRQRFDGDTLIAAGEVVRRDIAVLAGTLTVAGRVEGSIVVVNGDLALQPGAEITGDVLVVGGGVTGVSQARVQGEILSYPEPLHYREDGRRIRRVERPRTVARARPAERASMGRSDFLITTGKSYNRVEGLPITFGPRVVTEGSNPLRVHALGIYRTESGFTLDTDRMGYYVRAEQFLGGRQALRVGGTVHSVVDPIEEWQLSDLENGLATFLFHRDFRDHYERRGTSAFVQWEPRGGPFSLGGELRWERHRSQAAGSPWAIFNNAEPWRHQPLVAEGRLATVGANATFDTRSGRLDPASGWFLTGRLEHGFDVGLRTPSTAPDPLGPVEVDPARELFGAFRSGTIEIRRYNRVDPQSRLNFRLLAGGSLDGGPLPPQRQHAMGGEGSLPGYRLLSRDCGARDRVVYRPLEGGRAEPYFPAYGCDRFALLQTEFRGKLAFRLRFDSTPWDDRADESRGWGLDLDIAPDWVMFVNAGQGWTSDPARRDEELAADVGLGILVNRLGLFVAHPLTGRGGLNFFARLGTRF